jgi:5'-nucleotidase
MEYGRGTRVVISILALASLTGGCRIDSPEPDIDGQVIQLTLLHTSDIHSRLIPYDFDIGEVDRSLGLDSDNAPFGGAARMAFLIKREKASSRRALHIDTGDPFQGAPIFNIFEGEAEFRFLSETGVDAMVVGNHEFDRGAENLAKQLQAWARFTPLAANYLFEEPEYPGNNDLADLVQPYQIYNREGLRIGVIGLGDVSTMNSIRETGNSAGITPLNAVETAQRYIDLVKPMVDVVVLATHLGLSSDEAVIRGTTGADVLLGGHLHIVLSPPKIVEDCQTEQIRQQKNCTPRPVVLCHSGAFAKYVGRLDLALEQSADDPRDWEVVSHSHRLFAVDSTVPEDPVVADMMRVYEEEMERQVNLEQIIGYAPSTIRRFGSEGGDSALGNLVATSMWLRTGIETDFALTNTTGIRSDLSQGPVMVEDIYNVFPFDNTITTMFLTGEEVKELFDYVAHRTTVRGCQSQAQVAGTKVVLVCDVCQAGEDEGKTGCAPWAEIKVGSPLSGQTWDDLDAIDPEGVYELATNNYIAQGGSGYYMLQRNTTQLDSGIAQRDAVIDFIRGGKPCIDPVSCTSDSDCGSFGTCTCNGLWGWVEGTGCMVMPDGCTERICVYESCISDLAEIYAEDAVLPGENLSEHLCNWRNWAADECAELPCIDEIIDAKEDGRIEIAQEEP